MRELLSQTWSNLTANKLRSFLTMFGIGWGIISIVILSAVGEGFQRGNQAVLREFGKNILIINNGRTSMQAGGERAGRLIRLDFGDAVALKERSKLLEHVSPEILGYVKVKSSFNAASLGVSGVWPVYQQMRTIEVMRGRLMSEVDNDQARRVAVIGFDAGKQLFADRDPVGSEITLNGVPYTVIGKMRRKDQDSSYTGEDNERLFIPYEAARKDFPLSGSLTTANSISKIIATPFERVTEQLRRMTEAHGRNFLDSSGPVEFEVRTILGARHNFEPRDNEALPIWNTMLSSVMFSKMMNGISEFFIAVAVVTLGLGGIGVMNIMLIAVKERTREIGLRKALGATPRNIQWQFLSEGLLLTVLSGAIGLGLGLGLCKLVNLLPAPARFSGMIVTWQAAALSVVALALVGVVASTYPARRAAELPPIEALRFEM